MKLPAFLVLCLTLSPFTCWSQDYSALQEASQSIEKGDFVKAEAILRRFLQQNDPDASAYFLLGVTLGGLDRREESDQYLRRTLDLDQNLTSALRYLGINAFHRGDLGEAETYLKQSLEKIPGDGVAHLFLAQIAFSRNDFLEALKHFHQSPELVASDPRLQVLLSHTLLGAHEIEEGKKTLLAIRSSDSSVLFEVGLLLAQVGLYTEAIQKFLIAQPDYPDATALSFNLALTYFRMGELAAAISLLEEIAREEQTDADVFNLLGDAYRQVGRVREAYDALHKAVFLAPEDTGHYSDLLGLCLQLEAVETGLKIANLALRQHPNSYELYSQRAMLHLIKNQYRAAEMDFRKALEWSPENERLYWGLALVLMLDNRPEEARTFLENHQKEFTSYLSYYLYADVLIRLGLDRPGSLQTKIQKILEKSVQLNPNFAAGRANLGRLYATQQDWPRAIAELQAAIGFDPDHRAAYYQLSQIYLRTGEREKAQEMLAIVRKLNEQEAGRKPREQETIIQALQTGLRNSNRE